MMLSSFYALQNFKRNVLFVLLAFGLGLGNISCQKEQTPRPKIEQTVNLNKTSVTLSVGEKVLLKADFGSVSQPQKEYVWKTDNEEVVTLEEKDGYSASITAEKNGKAIVSIVSTDGVVTAQCEVTVSEEGSSVDEIKILAIGNSFSEDALEEHLYGLADAAGRTIVIGNLYIGGASLTTHASNAKNNRNAYQYRKIDQSGRHTNYKDYSIASALEDEDWDYVSLQQASSQAGKYVTHLPFIEELAAYVQDKATNPNMKLLLHQVWAYAQHSTHSGFATYDNDQMTMYTAIVETANRVKELADFELVVPSGTAIQNGRTSSIGDAFDRDGYHLDKGIGRYTASAVWFEALFKENVLGNTYKPEGFTDFEIAVGQNAAHSAILKPNEITELTEFQGEEAYPPLSTPVFVSFGGSKVSGWNVLEGASNASEGAMLNNMKDQNGESTSVSLAITEKFYGQNNGGEEKIENTEFDIPKEVSKYSYYGNSGDPWGSADLEIKQSTFKLSGLEKTKKYNLCFFSSRADVAENESRETKFIAQGDNEVVTHLEAANNKTNSSCAVGVRPDDNGEISVTVTAGDKNNNSNGFFYINAMRISLQ